MGLRRIAWVACSAQPLFSSNCASLAPRISCIMIPRQFPHSATRSYSDEKKPPGTDPENPAGPETPAAETHSKASPAQPGLGLDSLFGRSIFSDISMKPPERRSFGQSGSLLAKLPTDLGSRASKGLNVPPLSAPATEIPRTGPFAGRTVEVVADLPTALARLRSILTQNRVRIEQRESKFHVSPGLKRKRLKSLRHRRRFKEGFKKLVRIAMEMKRKGI